MAANGIVMQVQALAGLLGPILAGMLYGIGGVKPILAASAVCFFLSAVMELFLRIPSREERGRWITGAYGTSRFKGSRHLLNPGKYLSF